MVYKGGKMLGVGIKDNIVREQIEEVVQEENSVIDKQR